MKQTEENVELNEENTELNINDFIEMPVLALRGMVVFPEMVLHFDVGRKMSALAIEKAMTTDQLIFVAAQKEIEKDRPTIDDLYSVGVVAEVKQILRQPDNLIRVIVEGKYRARVLGAGSEQSYMTGLISPVEDIYDDEVTETAFTRSIKDIFERYLNLVPKFPSDVVYKISTSREPGKICDLIAGNTRMEYERKQELLEAINVEERQQKLIAYLTDEVFILEIEDSVHKMTRDRIDEGQREYYLREQLRVLEDELNIDDESTQEAKEYLDRLQELHLSEEVEKVLVKECEKLTSLPPGSQEANVIRNYLDTCLDLPWNTFDQEAIDVDYAQHILDKNHYGLTKVKERIVETLAVRKLSPDVKGQILCFVGPPGVGKTSIAQSIARAISRKCQRIALGVVHD